MTQARDFNNRYKNLPRGFDDTFAEIVSQETASVLKDKQTIDEAIQHIRERGNTELKQAHEKEMITEKVNN
ncbi:hypothetical protein D3C75_1234600 [compost metagenome]